jgi:hypothetical protein
MRGLLDDGLLSGQHEVTTRLRPERAARPIRVDDPSAALAEIEWMCQVWGGAGQALLPVADGSIPEVYASLLNTEQVDRVGGLQDIPVDLPRRVERRHPWDHPAILVASSEPRDRWRTVEVTDLEPDDPWRPIYAAVLGLWPDSPDARMVEGEQLREDLRFEDVLPVERVSVVGSLTDLIDRVLNRQVLNPRLVSNMFLAYGLEPDTSFMRDGQQVLPNPFAIRRAAGPNLIVAMTRDSVDDLALLWNLRSAHGGSRAMPIGIPAEQITADALQVLQQPGRATMFGWSGGRCHLVSASVGLGDLESLSSSTDAVRAVAYEDVLTFGPAPGRTRSHVTAWHDGRTRLDPESESDRELLRQSRGGLRGPHMILDVYVDGYPLPADGTMRGTDTFGRFQAGAAQVSVSELRRKGTVEVSWPSSWTCLAAVAQTRGLDVEQSEPGLAAATLIRALGGIQWTRMLQSQRLIELIYRMAERSGMSWWKKKWTDAHADLLAAGVDPATLERAAALLGRDDPAVAPAGEGRAVPFQDLVGALGSEAAASRWVKWAERRHLLVRGADVVCPECKTKSWLPLVALLPPIACAGCGRQINQPYGPRELRFTYRIGEPLRRVLETDSLGHVLALSWFVQLFHDDRLVGAHPGVTFRNGDDGRVIGEADVLLLFPDGALVPVEVKRRASGADARNEQSMDNLADAVSAPWDALVVTQPARDCGTVADMGRRLPQRPRVLLTDDQLHEEHVFWALGVDPFAWAPRTEEEDAKREAKFHAWLAHNDPEVPWYNLRDTLLDPALVANPPPAAPGPEA